ncbi:MAG TPA: indole-3-glycerol phosphate synthase TrpC [Gemmatimonadaceae bacterium]
MPNSKNIRTIPEAQENLAWAHPLGTLGRLTAEAAHRAASVEPHRSELERLARASAQRPSLFAALRRPDVALIAEIKRSSPSLGTIRTDLDAAAQARAYEAGGAAAISVLTEPESFGGTDDDLLAAVRAATIPVLRKDFHVTPAQLFHARTLGASAALLIVRALPPARFIEMVEAANGVGLEIVAEVRDFAELERALSAGAHIIGVNNRNLETLEIERGTAETVIPRIPRDCVAIAESGYSDRASVEAVAEFGADAVLIGSLLSAAADPELAVRRLTGISAKPRER